MPNNIVQQQFGPSAKHYAECEVHRSGASLERLVELVSPKANWRVLDVATGAGHTAAVFAPHVLEVIASDITPEMLSETEALARENDLGNIRTAVANSCDLPFDPESFDLATCRLAAHHFPDIAKFIGESRRVLRPGGLLAVVDNVTPDEQELDGVPVEEIEAAGVAYNAFEKLRDPSHARALSSAEWLRELSKSGFMVRTHEKIEKEMAFRPWLDRMRCDEQTAQELERTLLGPSALSRFLKPREIEGALHFTLREFIFVAARGA